LAAAAYRDLGVSVYSSMEGFMRGLSIKD